MSAGGSAGVGPCGIRVNNRKSGAVGDGRRCGGCDCTDRCEADPPGQGAVDWWL